MASGEVQLCALARGRFVAADPANAIADDPRMLAGNVLLEVDLAMKAPSANGTLERELLRVCHHVLHQMVFAEKPFCAYAAFKRFDPRMPHSVAPHVGCLRELHVTHIALKQLLGIVSLPMGAQGCEAERFVLALLAAVHRVTLQGVQSGIMILPAVRNMLFYVFAVASFLMVDEFGVILTLVFAEFANV